MFKYKAALISSAATMLIGIGNTAFATVIHTSFEGNGNSYLLQDSNSQSTTSVSTDEAHTGTHSAKLAFEQNLNANAYAKVLLPVPSGDTMLLGGSHGSFWTNIPSSSGNTEHVPYMYFAVDTGQGTSFIIPYTVGPSDGSVVTDMWMQRGINDGTRVHVAGARPNLDSSSFITNGDYNNGDTLSKLIGIGDWASYPLVSVRVGTGRSDTSLPNYIAYVDDIQAEYNVTSVPEPSSLMIFFLGLTGMILLKGRIRRQKVA